MGGKKPLQQFHSEGGVRICERKTRRPVEEREEVLYLESKVYCNSLNWAWKEKPSPPNVSPAANSSTPYPKPTVTVLSLPTHPPLCSIKFNFSLLSSRVKKKNFKESYLILIWTPKYSSKGKKKINVVKMCNILHNRASGVMKKSSIS